MNLEKLRVPPETTVRLKRYSSEAQPPYHDEQAARVYTEQLFDELRQAQTVFKAHDQYGLVVVLQGMDGAGKDETIQTVFSVFDPQICHAKQFKAPTPSEARHDFLWRVVQALPSRGEIAVFNRSYYEQVTAEQVYPEKLEAWGLPPEAREKLWEKRYTQINNFERHLVENGFPVLKFFLHIAQETERVRLLERVEQPELQGEFAEDDLQHHRDWNKLLKSYEAMLSHTSTPWAPWHVVPADQRWYTYGAVATVLRDQLRALHAELPPLDKETRQLLQRARKELQGEG